MTEDNGILKRIMERKKTEVAKRRTNRHEGQLLADIRGAPPTRGFAQALTHLIDQNKPAIIAEVKRASPSMGVIPHHRGESFDPATIAAGYANHGAACISCVTDQDFFQGSDAFVGLINKRMSLPILRKDFLYDPYQVLEARAMGADAILLIMALLSPNQAMEMEATATEMGLDVLVEVHDEAEMDAAHELQTPLLGINNRNLKSFETTLETSIQLAKRVEGQRIVVSESGINTSKDILNLQQHGIKAYLIGTAFMRQLNPGVALGEMLAELASA